MPKGKNEGDMDGTELSRWVKLSDKERVNDKYNFEGPVAEIEVTPSCARRCSTARKLPMTTVWKS